MSIKPVRPEGAPWISPYIIVGDVDRRSRFFMNRAFGFEKIHMVAAMIVPVGMPKRVIKIIW